MPAIATARTRAATALPTRATRCARVLARRRPASAGRPARRRALPVGHVRIGAPAGERGKPVAGADRNYVLHAPMACPMMLARASASSVTERPWRCRRRTCPPARTARGQALLVREDARGNVVDATYLQTPGALDALYAAAAMTVRRSAQRRVRQPPGSARGRRPRRQCRSASMRDGMRLRSQVVPMALDAARRGTWRPRHRRADLRGGYYTYLVDVVRARRRPRAQPRHRSVLDQPERRLAAQLHRRPGRRRR